MSPGRKSFGHPADNLSPHKAHLLTLGIAPTYDAPYGSARPLLLAPPANTPDSLRRAPPESAGNDNATLPPPARITRHSPLTTPPNDAPNDAKEIAA